jgi:hypothetical protein
MQTGDYSKFKLCNFNRDVKNTKELKASMASHGYIPAHPLHCVLVDGMLHIKDGHHRFEVAKSLGIPVWYVVCDDEATIHDLQKTTTSWKVADYADSYARSGRDEYQRVKQYQSETGIPLGMCISMLGGECATSSNKVKEFKQGRFTITPEGEAHAAQMRTIILKLKELGISPGHILIMSLSRLLFVKEFSVTTFLERMAANSGELKKFGNVEGQALNLEYIYNRNAKSHRLNIAFLADEVMNKRKIVS